MQKLLFTLFVVFTLQSTALAFEPPSNIGFYIQLDDIGRLDLEKHYQYFLIIKRLIDEGKY